MFLFLFYLFNLDVMHGSYDIYISTAYFLNINVSLKIVLPIVAFHNRVVSVVHGKIIFHVELNINIVIVVNISVSSV